MHVSTCKGHELTCKSHVSTHVVGTSNRMLQELKMWYMSWLVYVMCWRITARMLVLHCSTILAITFYMYIQMMFPLKYYKSNTQIYNVVVIGKMFEYYSCTYHVGKCIDLYVWSMNQLLHLVPAWTWEIQVFWYREVSILFPNISSPITIVISQICSPAKPNYTWHN